MPIILFTILALIITFPVIFNMSKLIYGYSDDTLSTIWEIWRDGNASLQIKDFLLFSSLNYETGDYNIYIHVLWPMMTFLTNEIFIWNITSISNFILSAFFMYLLVKHLTKNKCKWTICICLLTKQARHSCLACEMWETTGKQDGFAFSLEEVKWDKIKLTSSGSRSLEPERGENTKSEISM